ncbi:MAG: hypothetical protein IKX25_11335 [Bacteroidales bacterium]|nr:hypothetical protein [Bacteroidales bacterium]
MYTITIKNRTLSYLGDASMLLSPMTAFLCSHRVPESVSNAIRRWIDGLDFANTCVICGNLTGEERLARRLLIDRGIPVVLALANAIPENLEELRLTPQEMTAMQSGHMVIVSPITDETVKDASGKTSAARNQLMIAIAEHIVVGYMAENGNLARQLLGIKNVSVLKNEVQNEVIETDAQKAKNNAIRMGWAIYNRLKEGRPSIDVNNETFGGCNGSASETLDETSMNTASSSEELMPWESATKVNPVSSLEMRQLLAQYLNLSDIEKPSLLHSLVLFQVVKYYSNLTDFNFTAFFSLWGPENLRKEDWKATKVNEIWLPSLAERVMSRLFKAMPSKFHEPINKDEKFDPQIAHALLDEALQLAKKPNKRLFQRALNLAYFERNSEAIAKYRELLGKDAPQQE